MPVSARISATTSARLGWTNWRADRLTLMARRRLLGLPGPGLAAGLAQHLGADGHDQAGLLGQGDELPRPDQAAVGVLPADQRLRPHRAAAPQAVDRLVQDPELAPLDRPVQGAVHGQAALGPGPHGLVEHLAPVAAPGLGPVHGGVGVLDQRLGPGAAARGQGDADAHGDEHLGVAERERRGGHLGDPLGDGQGVGLVGDALAQDGELVAAEAGHGVAGPDDLLEALAQGDQQPVAGVVAERVVDELEPVQVEEQHRHRGAAALGPGQGQGDPVQEEDPVGQAGEGVVGGLVGQLGLGVAALDGDVGQVGGQLEQALLGRAGPAGLVEVDGEDAEDRVRRRRR